MQHNEWKLPNGRHILLLTLAEFEALPDNTELTSIFGDKVLKQDADNDTRRGYVAYGMEIPT